MASLKAILAHGRAEKAREKEEREKEARALSVEVPPNERGNQGHGHREAASPVTPSLGVEQANLPGLQKGSSAPP